MDPCRQASQSRARSQNKKYGGVGDAGTSRRAAVRRLRSSMPPVAGKLVTTTTPVAVAARVKQIRAANKKHYDRLRYLRAKGDAMTLQDLRDVEALNARLAAVDADIAGLLVAKAEDAGDAMDSRLEVVFASLQHQGNINSTISPT